MEKDIITKLTKNFEEYAHKEEGTEFWFARDLQLLLGYDKWENFAKIIEKAKGACLNSGQDASDIGSESKREIVDFRLASFRKE